MDIKDVEHLEKVSKHLRRQVVHMAYNAKSSHVGTALSTIDILNVLYNRFLNVSLHNYQSPDRDRFILSKGHGVSALYTILAYKGFFNEELLETYCGEGSLLPGHPKKDSVPGVEVSTGSLGHGLSIACGIALANKHSGNNAKTVVLMGDGECNEGSVFEAMMFASKEKLKNLIVIIDSNKWQAFGRVENIVAITPLGDKWKAFGWNVVEINGHNFEEINSALKLAYNNNESKPIAIIANTIKGKGVAFMEDTLEWHYKSPNNEQLNIAVKELE